MTQRCSRCKRDLPLDAFSPSYRGKPGTWCRECFTAYNRGDRGPSKPNEPRQCAYCGKTFTPKQQRAQFCSKACDQRQRQQDGRDREKHLLRKYGITQADYDRRLEEQGGGCALCGIKPEELTVGRYREFLHVDHDHDSGRFRGLLCPDCNLLIGRRPAEWFDRVVKYLAG